ncbi:unnamed protein product [Tuber melanosporum]|uniref:(Perigord truffle) hypothetical protein n=1 Tax=Tuber melanosporum (strain Mel28) TaxID=656061 RepID=D5GNY4_TUBMM|nr:uncharacterized protein GSTUM_00011584001 [Tuber melanosporum]CAZ86227.1 unnamed protein product [Tuber melanosporum]
MQVIGSNYVGMIPVHVPSPLPLPRDQGSDNINSPTQQRNTPTSPSDSPP